MGGASLFWLHVLVATAYLITALMICYEATAALFRRYAGSADPPTSLAERWKRKFKDALGVSGAHVQEPTRPLPRWSFIVAAYLPNSQEMILETITVNLSHLACERAGQVLIASTYRRLQRFFQHVALPEDWSARLVVHLLGLTGPWRLCLDRTNR